MNLQMFLPTSIFFEFPCKYLFTYLRNFQVHQPEDVQSIWRMNSRSLVEDRISCAKTQATLYIRFE